MEAWSGDIIFVAGGPAGLETVQPQDDWLLDKDPETTCCLTKFGSNADREIVMGIKPGATDGEGFFPHAIAMAINTLATKTTEVTWTANSNYVGIGLVVAVTLQYRIGDTGDWTNVEGSLKQGVNRLDETFAHNLPEECDDKELVQLRWLYYFEGDESADVQNGVFINILNISVVALEKPGTTPPPIANFSSVKNDREVTFLNNSQNGPFTAFSWSFGDGASSIEEDPIHNYSNDGEFEVCLAVTNDAGVDTFCKLINVLDLSPEPKADFDYSVDNTTATFTNNTEVETLGSFSWDFGDGNTETEEWEPQHTFAANGSYNVCLSVTNENGSDTICKLVKTQTSSGPGPVADFSYISLDLVFEFTNQSQNGPFDEVTWEFGDGETSTESNPNHYYATAGDYNVCLKLVNSEGTDSTCKTVQASTTSTSIISIGKGKLELYPNPANDILNFNGKFKQNSNIEIINAQGRMVKTFNGATENQIIISDLSPGIYFIRIVSDTGLFTNQFIKN